MLQNGNILLRARHFVPTLLKAALLCSGAVATIFAHAYQVNPIGKQLNPSVAFGMNIVLDKISKPVHETMTLIAYSCAQNPEQCRGRRLVFPAAVTQETVYLVEGVEWNDDPSLKLARGQFVTWGHYMYDGEQTAKCTRNHSQRCKAFSPDEDLLYRSHFGDLQFLHAMASSPGEPAEVTLKKIMDWAEFTYKIADRELSPFADLASLKKDGKTPVNDYIQRGSWNASYLFTHNTHQDEKSVRMIALGSLLHMIQDSYSSSHVYRENSCDPSSHNKPVVYEFYDYILQDPDRHGRADVSPGWLDNDPIADENAVEGSARVLSAWALGKNWTDVESIIRNTIFKFGAPLQASSGGDADCFAPLPKVEHARIPGQ